MIKRILIANRGEIAQRIIRACRELDIETGLIYSKEDGNSLAVKNADEAYCLGPRQGKNIYLDIEQIVNLAIKRNFDAIHPGYGFLSENSQFAQECQKNNLIFIGPEPKVIMLAGHKDQTKKLAKKCGIPVIDEIDKKKLRKSDFPLLLKASIGGGGKGIRVLEDQEDFDRLYLTVKRESSRAYGKAKILVEKYIENARHIEVQILADSYGKVIHLFERECSVQRRNQKIVEEAPCVSISAKVKQQLFQYAKDLAREMDYTNAGTFEFLVDDKERIYFLEVNPRIQVEHTVTEEITGFDLVKEQIRLAEGKPLSMSQKDIKKSGHSIQCRVTSENLLKNLNPTTGKITKCLLPMGKGIRVSGDVYAGKRIYPNYDPLILKLIVKAENRTAAIARMRQALNELEITGISTNLNLLRAVLTHPLFEKNKISIQFIKKYGLLETAQKIEKAKKYDDELDFRELESRKVALIAAVIYQKMEQEMSSRITPWVQKTRMTHN
jgi:acetyl-CoA carboxylase biotin carboxylase subunit